MYGIISRLKKIKFFTIKISINFFVSTVFLLSASLYFGKTVAFYDFSSCDQRITLFAGQSIPIRSPYWPRGFVPGSSCRYNIQAPFDYQIQVTCGIDFVDVNTSFEAEICFSCNRNFYFLLSPIETAAVYQENSTLSEMATSTFLTPDLVVVQPQFQELRKQMR